MLSGTSFQFSSSLLYSWWMAYVRCCGYSLLDGCSSANILLSTNEISMKCICSLNVNSINVFIELTSMKFDLELEFANQLVFKIFSWLLLIDVAMSMIEMMPKSNRILDSVPTLHVIGVLESSFLTIFFFNRYFLRLATFSAPQILDIYILKINLLKILTVSLKLLSFPQIVKFSSNC